MHPCVEGRDSFEFPLGSFLQIWGIVKEEELCRLDMNGEECLIVIKVPTSPEAQRVPKEARPICKHPIAAVWRELREQVYKFFDSLNIKWTSIDPVRFGEVRGEPGPLFLWVGVMPRSLSRKDAEAEAIGCKQLLAAFQLMDVEIAFRESIYTRSASPQLLDYIPSGAATADIGSPFTPSLGLRIAPRNYPHFEGTGGLYLHKGDQVLLLTARHVVLPPSEYLNELYRHQLSSQPRHDVILLGTKAYENTLESMTAKIGTELVRIQKYKGKLAVLGDAVEGEDASIADERKTNKDGLAKVEETIRAVDKFHSDMTKHWSAEDLRVLGYVFRAPPISVSTGKKCFTEDWALVELHHEKIDWTGFKGNVLNLGTF